MKEQGYQERLKGIVGGNYQEAYPYAVWMIREIAWRNRSNKARMREIKRVLAAMELMELI